MRPGPRTRSFSTEESTDDAFSDRPARRGPGDCRASGAGAGRPAGAASRAAAAGAGPAATAAAAARPQRVAHRRQPLGRALQRSPHAGVDRSRTARTDHGHSGVRRLGRAQHQG